MLPIRPSKRSRTSDAEATAVSPVSRSETVSNVSRQQIPSTPYEELRNARAVGTIPQRPSGRFSESSASSSLRHLPSSFRTYVSGTKSSTVRSHIKRIRHNLETTGSYTSSRSVASHSERITESVVDVGEDTLPSTLEELIARLEHHGVRRCTADRGEPVEDPPTSPDADTAVVRRPYYYMCMPCEQRLTTVSARAATMETLQDVHHHVSSAKHRRIAAWMGSSEIDSSLRTNPSMAYSKNKYTYIHVNGTPTLIAKAPGGGDLFQFLPHEMNGKAKEFAAGESIETALTCANPSMEFMYCPRMSLTSRCNSHAAASHRHADDVPSHSVKLLSLHRAGTGKTLHYVVRETPSWEAAVSSATQTLDRTPIVSESVYRAVVSAETPSAKITPSAPVSAVQPEPLTRAALTLLSTSAGPEQPGTDAYASDVDAELNSQNSDHLSDLSDV